MLSIVCRKKTRISSRTGKPRSRQTHSRNCALRDLESVDVKDGDDGTRLFRVEPLVRADKAHDQLGDETLGR